MRISIAGKSSNKGYTLIELVAVVVLIGLFLTISVPKLRETLFSSNLKSAVRRLTGTIEQLRSDAVREHQELRLNFDLDSESYWVTSSNMNDKEIEDVTRIRLPSGVDLIDIVSPSGKVMVGSAKIRFSPRGYVEEALIHLGDRSDNVYTLFLPSFLPKVKIENQYIE
ncbi:MAG: prepilin-type N-terminal cleavage/methylation domain-containing protein [Deltaproteobacteria bacterium]|nr:prepilin-type N-terminal cleavage/methylation domain-containing protein [Deltaproteobacteria bacterium]